MFKQILAYYDSILQKSYIKMAKFKNALSFISLLLT